MTQAQIAQWLGVTIKQVKYLEHQRRNPSGPTRRLLDILAAELKFEGGLSIQVLGASAAKRTISKRATATDGFASINPEPPKVVREAMAMTTEPAEEQPALLPKHDEQQVSDDGAFVWQ